jgi:hypothetical protein
MHLLDQIIINLQVIGPLNTYCHDILVHFDISFVSLVHLCVLECQFIQVFFLPFHKPEILHYSSSLIDVFVALLFH